jgi:Phosphatase-1 catalytic subunit binding region
MKKVHFNECCNKVHPMILWSFAYRNARKTYWEYFVLDRGRFQRRIQETAVIINPILDCNYRLKVYNERFK